MKKTKIKSGFCILDVKSGRRLLEKQIKKSPVRVIIEAKTLEASNDDGMSTEFFCYVLGVRRK